MIKIPKEITGFKKEELLEILKISVLWGAINGSLIYFSNYLISYIYMSIVYKNKAIILHKILFMHIIIVGIISIIITFLAIAFYYQLPFKNLFKKIFALKIILDLSIIFIFLGKAGMVFGLLVFITRIVSIIIIDYIYAKKISEKLKDKILKKDLIKIPGYEKIQSMLTKKDKITNLNLVNKWFLFLGKLIFFIILSILTLEILSYTILNFDVNYVESYKDLKYFEIETYDTMQEAFQGQTRKQVIEFILEFYDGYKAKFHPYLVYDIEPFQGKYNNLKSSSVGVIRETINPCATEDSQKIWFFGGSTAVGYLNRDSRTIASLLSKNLCEHGFNINITNYGAQGYQNTQELIKFFLLLKKEQKPDLVIFYDGFNDIYSVSQTGEVDLPLNIENRYLEFNSRDNFNIVRPLIKKSYTMKFLQRYIIKPKGKTITFNAEEKSTEIVNNYIKNDEIIKAIATKYNIKVLHFWQPTLFDRKKFFGQEGYIEQTSDKKLKELTLLTSEKIKYHNEKILILSNVFTEDHPFMVYNDFVHTDETGNDIIANEIANHVVKIIK